MNAARGSLPKMHRGLEIYASFYPAECKCRYDDGNGYGAQLQTLRLFSLRPNLLPSISPRLPFSWLYVQTTSKASPNPHFI